MTDNSNTKTTVNSATIPKRNNAASKHSRRWIPILGAALLIALIIAGLWPRPTPVETAKVSRGLLLSTVNEEGKTRIKHKYLVSAPVAGQLRRIPFKAGAEVMAGQTVLAVIDPAPPLLLDARSRALAEARLEGAVANRDKAQTNEFFANIEMQRISRLFQEKAVSIQEYEAAQVRESLALKEKSAAESALRQVEAELSEYRSRQETNSASCTPLEIKAPINGRILRVFEENSRVVATGTPLVEVGDPTDLEVVIDVLSRDGAAIQPGAKIILEQWGGTEPLEGRLRLVEPSAFTKISALGVEEQRVNCIADLVTPPEKRTSLGDNFRVEAKIVLWETPQALRAPVGALFRQGQEWKGFVVQQGYARLRTVKVGKSSSTEMQILDGFQEGDELILYPGDRIKEGFRVKPVQLN